MRKLAYTADSPQSIKLGDSSDTLSLRVTELDQPVDLSKVSSITVKIGNTLGFLTEIDVAVSSLLHPTDGRIDVAIDSKISSELPSGQYLLEVWIDDAQGNTAIYPDTSYPSVIGFSVKRNIMAATSTVITTLTLADFEAKFDDLQKDLQDKVTSGYFKGDKGDTGVGVSSSTVTYQLSSSGTTTPTGTWSSSVLAQTTALPYLWTKTVITYSNSTTTTMYSISSKGDTGTVDNAGLTNAPAFQALQTQVNNSAVGTNLLTGTSGDLQAKQIAYDYNIGPQATNGNYKIKLFKGQTYTYRVWIDNTNGSVPAFVNVRFAPIGGTDYNFGNGTPIVQGATGYSTVSVTPSADGYALFTPFAYGSPKAFLAKWKEEKLEVGSVATDWSLNPSEILTQTDYAKIQAAIVALGGSLS